LIFSRRMFRWLEALFSFLLLCPEIRNIPPTGLPGVA
jgi:hypothetical protein